MSLDEFRSSLIDRYRTAPWEDMEQALTRLVVGISVLAYLYFIGFTDDRLAQMMWGSFALLSLVLVIVLLMNPKPDPVRRVCGMVIDIGYTSYAIWAAGPYGVPLFFVYVWVTIGNGFRYGNPYLFTSLFLSLAGFGVASYYGFNWEHGRTVAMGVLLCLLLIPLYAAKLNKRLHSALKQAKAASAAKSQFLANMSHEIRTPLNGVIGLTDILQNTRLTQRQGEITEGIKHSADALMALIDDVLDISKIESGKLEIEPVPFEISDTVKGVTKMLETSAQLKNITLRSHIDAKLPEQMVGDERRLRQVLINLIGNAIKFTDEGEVEVRVSTTRADSEKIGVRFEVIDTGVGISPEDQARIFESFTQADNSDTRRYQGSGLGTTISKQLVELMGGQLGLQSSIGQGSRFWFVLDFDRCRQVELVAPKPREAATGDNVVAWKGAEGHRSAVGLSVLVAEDNPVNRKVTSMVLENAGHEVTMMGNGAQVLEALEHKSYDVVILDLQMPVLGGLEAMQLYRAANFNRGHLPFIILTANATTDARNACLEAGVDAFMTKPVNSMMLLEEIARVTGSESPRQRSEPAEGEEHPSFDPARIIEIEQMTRSGDGSNLVKLFQKDVRTTFDGLARAISEGRQKDFRELTHALKGSSSSVGALGLAALCDRARQISLADFPTHSRQLLGELEKEYERFLSAYRDFTEGRGKSGAAPAKTIH